MPRQPRLDAPGTLHRVTGGGIEGYSGVAVWFLGVTTSPVDRLAVSPGLLEVARSLKAL